MRSARRSAPHLLQHPECLLCATRFLKHLRVPLENVDRHRVRTGERHGLIELVQRELGLPLCIVRASQELTSGSVIWVTRSHLLESPYRTDPVPALRGQLRGLEQRTRLLKRVDEALRIPHLPETARCRLEVARRLKRCPGTRGLPGGQIEPGRASVIAAPLVELGGSIDLPGGRPVIRCLCQISRRFELFCRSLSLIARRVMARAQTVGQNGLTHTFQGARSRPKITLEIRFNRCRTAGESKPFSSRELNRQPDGAP